MTLQQMNVDLLRNLGIIAEVETMLDKLTKYARRLVKQMTEDSACMTKEEYFAMLDRAEKGSSAAMLPNEDVTAFLRRQGYDL